MAERPARAPRRLLELAGALLTVLAAVLLAMEWTYPCTPLGCRTPDPDRLARQISLPLNVRGTLATPVAVRQAGCEGLAAAARRVRLAGDQGAAVRDYLSRSLPGQRWSEGAAIEADDELVFWSRWQAGGGRYRLVVSSELEGPGQAPTGPAERVTVVTLLVSGPHDDATTCPPDGLVAAWPVGWVAT